MAHRGGSAIDDLGVPNARSHDEEWGILAEFFVQAGPPTVREAMQVAGLSYRDLADLCGVEPDALRTLVNGELVLRRAQELLGVSDTDAVPRPVSEVSMEHDLKDLARRLGVTEKELARSYEAKALADRAERMRVPLELHERAAAELPRMARRLLAEQEETGTVTVAEVAVYLGLVSPTQTASEALAALRQLADAESIPEAPRANGSAAHRAPTGALVSGYVLEALAGGALTRADLYKSIPQCNKHAVSGALQACIKGAWVRQVGDAYELVNGEAVPA